MDSMKLLRAALLALSLLTVGFTPALPRHVNDVVLPGLTLFYHGGNTGLPRVIMQLRCR